MIKVGDLAESTIKQVFNSERIREMRRMLSDGSVGELKPCDNCDRIKRKTFMGVPKEYMGSFLRDNFKK